MSDAAPTAPAGLAARLPPEVAAGLGALSRVARALTGPGTLDEIAVRALTEMRDALALDACALYVPDGGRPVLRLRSTVAPADGLHTRAELALDEDAWRLMVAGGSPLVFREPAAWLVENPFEPAARHWLVLPLAGGGALAGVVVAARAGPVELDPLGATVLSLLAGQLHAGLTTAELRLELERAAVEGERARLAAEVHDGLAQDLAVAMRELALLDGDVPPALAAGSRERLRQAVASAHRVVRARLVDLTSPLPAAGLRAGAEAACARAAARGLDVRAQLGPGRLEAPPPATAALLRVLTEALANAERHAPAARVDVALSATEGAITLTVRDGGPGFDPAVVPGAGEGHLGLGLMRRRATEAGGELTLTSAPGAGTEILLRLPPVA